MDGRHAGLLTGRQMYIQPEKLPVNKSYNAHTLHAISMIWNRNTSSIV